MKSGLTLWVAFPFNYTSNLIYVSDHDLYKNRVDQVIVPVHLNTVLLTEKTKPTHNLKCQQSSLTCNVLEKNKWNVSLTAQFNEMCPLKKEFKF